MFRLIIIRMEALTLVEGTEAYCRLQLEIASAGSFVAAYLYDDKGRLTEEYGFRLGHTK